MQPSLQTHSMVTFPVLCYCADPDYQAFLSELQEGPQLLPSAAVQRERQDKDRLLTGALGTSGAGAAKQVGEGHAVT